MGSLQIELVIFIGAFLGALIISLLTRLIVVWIRRLSARGVVIFQVIIGMVAILLFILPGICSLSVPLFVWIRYFILILMFSILLYREKVLELWLTVKTIGGRGRELREVFFRETKKQNHLVLFISSLFIAGDLLRVYSEAISNSWYLQIPFILIFVLILGFGLFYRPKREEKKK